MNCLPFSPSPSPNLWSPIPPGGRCSSPGGGDCGCHGGEAAQCVPGSSGTLPVAGGDTSPGCNSGTPGLTACPNPNFGPI